MRLSGRMDGGWEEGAGAGGGRRGSGGIRGMGSNVKPTFFKDRLLSFSY